MSDTGLVEERGMVEPVAVGPGDVATNGHAASRLDDGGTGAPVEGSSATGTGAPDSAMAPALPVPSLSTADASLLALIDRLSGVLEKGDLAELEVSAGDTTIILRAPSAIATPVAVAAAPLVEAPGTGPAVPGAVDAGGGSVPSPTLTAPAAKPSVKAPLTGIYYGAPSPGATAYVQVGDHVSVGQIIGLIEAMKLFNEIKSDLAGRVARICVDNGALVKAKQPLIEVESA